MKTTKKSFTRYVPPKDLRDAFRRLKNPKTEEDRQLVYACAQVRQDLKRLWANRQNEVEEWEKRHLQG